MHEELALAVGIVTPKSDGVTPGRNVHLEDPELPVVHSRVTTGDLGRSLSKGLDLGSDEHNAALQGLENVIVVSGTAISGDDLVVSRVLALFGPSALNDF